MGQTIEKENEVGRQKLFKSSSSGWSCYIIIFSILFAAISCIIYISLYSHSDMSTAENYNCTNETVFLAKFRELKAKFPLQLKRTWLSFAAGIQDVLEKEPTVPSSFLLLHEEGDKTANCLVNEISKFASNCLTGSDDVVYVNGKNLREEVSEDSGKLITIYKDKVLEKNVMIVKNLNELPGEVIKEFHYFCDTENPLIRKAVYFFILSTKDNISDGDGISYKVSKLFHKLWNDSLKDNMLLPLITRMTGNIVTIIRENTCTIS